MMPRSAHARWTALLFHEVALGKKCSLLHQEGSSPGQGRLQGRRGCEKVGYGAGGGWTQGIPEPQPTGHCRVRGSPRRATCGPFSQQLGRGSGTSDLPQLPVGWGHQHQFTSRNFQQKFLTLERRGRGCVGHTQLKLEWRHSPTPH